MDQNRVVPAYFMLELTNGFKERLAFDITYRTAHLNNGNARVLVCKVAVETAFDLVGNVRDNLYGSAAVVTAPLFLQY